MIQADFLKKKYMYDLNGFLSPRSYRIPSSRGSLYRLEPLPNDRYFFDRFNGGEGGCHLKTFVYRCHSHWWQHVATIAFCSSFFPGSQIQPKWHWQWQWPWEWEPQSSGHENLWFDHLFQLNKSRSFPITKPPRNAQNYPSAAAPFEWAQWPRTVELSTDGWNFWNANKIENKMFMSLNCNFTQWQNMGDVWYQNLWVSTIYSFDTVDWNLRIIGCIPISCSPRYHWCRKSNHLTPNISFSI